MKIGDKFIATRDSDDLGVDRGMTLVVTDIHSDGTVALQCDALDMCIAGVSTDHPDLAPVRRARRARCGK